MQESTDRQQVGKARTARCGSSARDNSWVQTQIRTSAKHWIAAARARRPVYKSLLACAARLIKAELWVITTNVGGRIMGVYISGSKNTAAVRTAMKIRYVVDEIVNTARRNQHPKNEYAVRHVIGVDTSELFVARTGVRGVNDLVWVGRAANYAATLAALPEARSTYAEVFNAMHASVKLAKNGTGEAMTVCSSLAPPPGEALRPDPRWGPRPTSVVSEDEDPRSVNRSAPGERACGL